MNQSRYPDSKNANSIDDGLEFQDLVVDTLAEHGVIVQNYSSKSYQCNIGENRQGIEIKLDKRSADTGRLSIEIAEKTATDRNWVSSGIYRGDSWLYVQGHGDRIWVFFTAFLRKLHATGKYKEHEEATVRGFFLPLSEAEKYGHSFETVYRLRLPVQEQAQPTVAS